MRLTAKAIALLVLAIPAAQAQVMAANPAAPPPVAMPAGQVSAPVATSLVENYFNSLTTMKADFSQSVSGEAFASEGTFYLKRPRQFLWQYDTPVKQKIVSTGTAVYYVDQSSGHDGQVTQLPMNSGLGKLFNAKVLRLPEEGLRVTSAVQSAGQLNVTLGLVPGGKIGPDGGFKQAMLTFDQEGSGKLTLRRVEVVDATGAKTSVSFDHVQTGTELSSALFKYTPGVYRQPN